MAAFNYYPATFQNPYQSQNYFGLQLQQPQIPLVQPQPLANQMPVTQSGILWVSSETEAQNYPVAPNNAVALWDSSRPAVYLKQADASGKPSLKAYDLVERSERPKNADSITEEKKTAGYVTKREFEALAASVDDMRKELDRRIASRKKEVKEDDV